MGARAFYGRLSAISIFSPATCFIFKPPFPIWRLSRLKTEGLHLAASTKSSLELYSRELEGLITHKEGDDEAAEDILKQVAKDQMAQMERRDPSNYSRPSYEVLGEFYVATGRFELAREAYHEALKARPGSGHARYGIARSFTLEGRYDDAEKAYIDFLEAWKNADPDLKQVCGAKTWLSMR